jgi:hypothetical protein
MPIEMPGPQARSVLLRALFASVLGGCLIDGQCLSVGLKAVPYAPKPKTSNFLTHRSFRAIKG